MKYIKPVFIFALLLGLFMRGWQARERFLYAHDSDLASWIVKDIVIDHHLRLIGQETSQKGIFIGPLFYYSLIPFYLVTGMDPVGSLAYSMIIGLISISSLYYVTCRLYGNRSAAIASLIYAGSFLISQTEREVVPTTPVMLWSIWFFYAVNLIFKKQKTGLLLAAFLIGLVWHLNLALILLSPLVLIGIFLNRKDFTLPDFLKPMVVLVLMLLPLLIFETRHNFLQTRSLLGTFNQIFTATGTTTVGFSSKLSHVTDYVYKNATRIFLIPQSDVSERLLPVLLTVSLVLLLMTRKIPAYTGMLFLVWMGFYILFFTLLPMNLSEYYLNGMNIFWIIIAAVMFGKIIPKIMTVLIMIFLIVYNLNMFLTSPVNASGYLQKKAMVAYINSDARSRGYPCVAFSYITNPGYQFGYRYFIYLQQLKTKAPSEDVPVYTVVFPHSLVDRIDMSFGALGLVLPDYSRYDEQKVSWACTGQNANLTDPVFGFNK